MESVKPLTGKNVAKIEIFFDEIEPEKNCNYLILGAMFIKTEDKDKITNTLLDSRCQCITRKKWCLDYLSCPNKENCKESWHNLNDTEIHFNEIRESRSSQAQIKIAKSWLNFFMLGKKVQMAVLYIDLDKLDSSFFGGSNVNANIYNKFFRTLINYGLKCFFNSYDKIEVTNIFYDRKGELERHSFFNKFNFSKLIYESGGNIELLGKIIFIDSDHKIEKYYKNESHLIQFVDLIIGAIRQNIFYISKDSIKNNVARVIRGKLLKLKKKYWSSNFIKVSFFPKNKLKSVNDLEKNLTSERNDEFYSLMDLDLKMPAQETNLNKWF